MKADKQYDPEELQILIYEILKSEKFIDTPTLERKLNCPQSEILKAISKLSSKGLLNYDSKDFKLEDSLQKAIFDIFKDKYEENKLNIKSIESNNRKNWLFVSLIFGSTMFLLFGSLVFQIELVVLITLFLFSIGILGLRKYKRKDLPPIETYIFNELWDAYHFISKKDSNKASKKLNEAKKLSKKYYKNWNMFVEFKQTLDGIGVLLRRLSAMMEKKYDQEGMLIAIAMLIRSFNKADIIDFTKLIRDIPFDKGAPIENLYKQIGKIVFPLLVFVFAPIGAFFIVRILGGSHDISLSIGAAVFIALFLAVITKKRIF